MAKTNNVKLTVEEQRQLINKLQMASRWLENATKDDLNFEEVPLIFSRVDNNDSYSEDELKLALRNIQEVKTFLENK